MSKDISSYNPQVTNFSSERRAVPESIYVARIEAVNFSIAVQGLLVISHLSDMSEA